jgi:hypothetical protein
VPEVVSIFSGIVPRQLAHEREQFLAEFEARIREMAGEDVGTRGAERSLKWPTGR